ncbi:hypothetical protein I6I18_00225 [Kytococcus sedentarius]|uniref:SdpI/YhfL protein family n=1 Tax=Kytococcus sedentarius (strain ATCC 14392 / DSM 20547 / JCM 11482 / CCUG 33030 / NBRC 15357 / NCTC 11040 / CCM 314 / 541) TaxID=478801 RepID=C7NKR7_KYTSD|nr:hypothetical protein [Kytococcus sedentarius]ACV05553.1 hypothetical protein Ksed_04830 [Kytococcus sedentarius DSM 20547]QQB63987.1 hypothetical protein I6I18_00225 [Kytococcus sedentarius]STX13033.1 Uncharacterised protein [Kytococcus sedentarius]
MGTGDGRLEQMGRLEAMLLLVIVGGVLLPTPWISRLLTHARTMPWVNLPHKEFWVRTPRRLARAERLTWEVLAVLTLWAGTLTAVPLIGTAWAAQGGALPPEWVVPAALGADLVLVPVLLVWIEAPWVSFRGQDATGATSREGVYAASTSAGVR